MDQPPVREEAETVEGSLDARTPIQRRNDACAGFLRSQAEFERNQRRPGTPGI